MIFLIGGGDDYYVVIGVCKEVMDFVEVILVESFGE